ncbi:MAG: type II toxin-antitoxin system VapC family toxin [Microgenomates group bacterium]
MKKNVYVLDSYALLPMMQDVSGAQFVEDLLVASQEKRATIFMSIINLGEIVYILERRLGVDHAQNLLAIIDNLAITVEHADRERVLSAARFKATGGLSYADSFALALAVEKEATLVTGDSEFKQFEKKISIKWI